VNDLRPSDANARRLLGPARAWRRFWFTPADPAGLHAVRLLAGLLFFAWLLPLAGHVDALFGLDGWFDGQAYREAGRIAEPPVPVGWSLLYLAGHSRALLLALYGLSLAVLALFTAGVWPRLTAPLAWVVVASFLANPVARSDGDELLAILALYLAAGYVLFGLRRGRLAGPAFVWPLGGRRPDNTAPPASCAANLALRLLQVHLAIVVVVSGLHKLQFGDWWAGVAYWYPLHRPFETILEVIRARAAGAGGYLILLSLAQYAALAWQLTFPFFAWRRAWRPVLLAGGVFGWLGAAFLYREPLFGPALFVGCLSYLTPEEWLALRVRVGRALHHLRRPEAARPVPEQAGAKG
jgi:hypothetical protein